jgi:hypothetical protein
VTEVRVPFPDPIEPDDLIADVHDAIRKSPELNDEERQVAEAIGCGALERGTTRAAHEGMFMCEGCGEPIADRTVGPHPGGAPGGPKVGASVIGTSGRPSSRLGRKAVLCMESSTLGEILHGRSRSGTSSLGRASTT